MAQRPPRLQLHGSEGDEGLWFRLGTNSPVPPADPLRLPNQVDVNPVLQPRPRVRRSVEQPQPSVSTRNRSSHINVLELFKTTDVARRTFVPKGWTRKGIKKRKPRRVERQTTDDARPGAVIHLRNHRMHALRVWCQANQRQTQCED